MSSCGPQVLNFAQTALGRCSMLHIDRNAKHIWQSRSMYLLPMQFEWTEVRPGRKESPMQVKKVIIAT
jgi:hypothetical protein